MVLVTLLVYAVIFILSDLLRPKPDVENARKSSLGDFSFPTATEDRPVPLVWGTVKLSGPNVVWYGDLKQKAITDKVGGGMFSDGETVINGYRYFMGIQFGLCRGSSETVELVRIWNSEEVIYDGGVITPGAAGSTITINEPNLYGGLNLGTGGLKGDLTFFGGREDQTASTYLSGFQTEGGDTPGYRGMCYAVWERGFLGTSTSIRPWEFEVRRIPVGLGVTDSTVNGGNDANPAHVIYEYITNSEWGLGQPAADVDVANFQAVASTLATEGNGFSFQLETTTQGQDFLGELERQIAGKVFLNQTTGKWQIKLARNDYVLGSLPLIDETNLVEEQSFSRGAWEDTTNDVKVKFADRALDYKGTFAQAQDPANQLMQGSTITATPQFPGVKDATLANNLAWRELRNLTRPLAKATLVVDRNFWDTVPLDVLRWTDTAKGFTDLAVRVMKVDLGSLQDNKVTLTVIEDIFSEVAPSFGDPFGTGWVPPVDTLVAIPANESIIIDAPRAFLTRDDNIVPGSEPAAKVWCGFRAQGSEPIAEIRESNALVTPNDTFGPGGFINATFEIGTLVAAMEPSAGLNSFDVAPQGGTLQQDILDALADAPSTSIMGQQLLNLILVEDEFMLVGTRATAAGNVTFGNVYRGVLDSTPRPHAINTKVYLICAGGALTDPSFPETWTVDVRLLPESSTDKLLEASATEVQVSLDDRLKRPYPPAKVELDGAEWPTGTISLDVQQGGNEDTKGNRLQFVRRDFRASSETDASGLLIDEASLPADFPANNTTEYEIEVRNDPDGANTLLFTIPFGTATNDTDILRTLILKNTAGVIPSKLRINVNARHTYLPDSTVYTSRESLRHDYDTSSAQLSGLENDGVLDTNVVGSFVAPTTDTYLFTIGTDLLSTGVLEAQINGGGYSTVISSSTTSGTLAGVTSGDTVDYRHTQTGGGTTETMLIIEEDTLNIERVYAILDI